MILNDWWLENWNNNGILALLSGQIVCCVIGSAAGVWVSGWFFFSCYINFLLMPVWGRMLRLLMPSGLLSSQEPVLSKEQPAFQYSSHVSLQASSGHMW